MSAFFSLTMAGIVMMSASGYLGVNGLGTAFLIYLIVVFIPSVWILAAVSVKRLHDQGISGSWGMLYFVPVIGTLFLFVLLGFTEGNRCANRFGPPVV